MVAIIFSYSERIPAYETIKKRSNECQWIENMISKFEQTGELGVIPGTRGRRPVNPERVQQIDNAIAPTISGASMLQQVSA
ncbi:hypothetical protein TNCV_4567001 [Trichonephila clavipes]|nr:hypothetical protein TNCV_4567001 [Trichonephila clavipes]